MDQCEASAKASGEFAAAIRFMPAGMIHLDQAAVFLALTHFNPIPILRLL
jgi:hypothetical protein